MGQPLTAAVRFLSGEREPVRVATTGNITMQGLLVIDDVELDVGDRVLVKDQTDQKQNGIYLASEGRWFRAPDASWTRSINQGVTVQVQEGTANHDKTYRFDTQDPVVGVDPIVISYYLSSNLTEEMQAIVDSAAEQAAELATQGAATVIEPLVDAAEAAAESAADYADFARNNWAVLGPFTGTGAEEDYLLSIDPGSPNNMFVIVGGVGQLSGSYELVHADDDAFIRINVPEDVPFEVRVSNAIPVGTPADGSVTTAKLADDAVTFAKLQNISGPRLLGRTAAGSGNAGEVAAEQLRDVFLPVGSVVDHVSAEFTSNAAINGSIPGDNTVPQVTEGVEILSATITPKATSNKLFVLVDGQVITTTANVFVWAIFQSGSTNAVRARYQSAPANSPQPFGGQVIISPSAVTPVTVSVRVGTGGADATFNGNPGGPLYGGTAAPRIDVFELKG